MTTSCDDDGRFKWRLVGAVEDLSDRPCRRLHPMTSPAAGDLVLVFVARLGKFFALDGSCGHMGGPLYSGDIEDCRGRSRIVCPWHGYAFDVETGMSDIGLPQKTYDVKVDDGKVYVKYTSELVPIQ